MLKLVSFILSIFILMASVSAETLSFGDRVDIEMNNRVAKKAIMNGEYLYAGSILEKNINILKQKLGNSHPDTLNSISNTAMLYGLNGYYDESSKLYNEALPMLRKTYGINSTEEFNLMSQLVVIGLKNRKVSAIEKVAIDAAKRTESTLGIMHPSSILALVNLARVKYEKCEYEEADSLFETALERRIENKDQIGIDRLRKTISRLKKKKAEC